MTVLAAHNWKSNAELIADVAKLGYINKHDVVLDPTFGRGRWWTKWRPIVLYGTDIRNPLHNPCPYWIDCVLHLQGGIDFRNLPHEDDTFDVVAFDPPYKLNGTPSTPDFDDRYGVHEPTSWQDRHGLIRDGIAECERVLRPGGRLLLKCQDQVCSGKVRWQTREFADFAERCRGLELVDRFDMLGTHRPQPEGRRQVHAHGRPSTLLVFVKPGGGGR